MQASFQENLESEAPCEQPKIDLLSHQISTIIFLRLDFSISKHVQSISDGKKSLKMKKKFA